MQIIAKNIRWRALMGTYQTAKFDPSPNNLSWDTKNKKKKKKKNRTKKGKKKKE